MQESTSKSLHLAFGGLQIVSVRELIWETFNWKTCLKIQQEVNSLNLCFYCNVGNRLLG